MDSVPEKLAELEQRIKALELDREKWRNLQVAQESGGGGITEGGTSMVLRITALTPGSVQMP